MLPFSTWAGTDTCPAGATVATGNGGAATSQGSPRTRANTSPAQASPPSLCDTAACDVACRDGEILSGHGHAQYFLPNGILIVEGLQGLSKVPTSGLFLAMPLKIGGGTGSPVHVLLLSD